MSEAMPSRGLLNDLPPSAESHFRLHLYALIAKLLAHLKQADAQNQEKSFFARFPFLMGYEAALRSYQPAELPLAAEAAWWQVQRDAWENQTPGHLPLRALVNEAGLAEAEVQLLLAAGLVEEDIRFGAVFAALQEPLVSRRPCLGVLSWLLGEPDGAQGDLWLACRTLLELGLVVTDNRVDPRSEWVLRVPPAIWDAVRGQPLAKPAPNLTLQAGENFPSLQDLILSEEWQAQVARIPELLAGDQINALVLRGMSGSGRRTVIGTVARALGRDVLLAENCAPGDDTWKLLGPLATLTGAIPVLRCNPGPGETLELPSLPGYRGVVGIALGRGGGLRGPLVERALSLNLPPPDHNARRRFWIASGISLEPNDLEEISDRFLLTGGHIHRAATLALANATLAQRATVIAADVQQATRTLNRQALETLATHLDAASGWNDLVLNPATSGELRTFETRCRKRETLRECSGAAFDRNLTRGVRALFSGPSGTGKTLAAQVLAAVLQMDLYRVDLAAVVNKYIGETERNLNQVLSRAEELDVILLLDEGDALMTKRTEVRNANDRYANLETNYLLQRLETYEGIVIITTNAGSRIDSAFLRRIDVIIDFPPPEATERWLIWRSHLPQPNQVSPRFLEEVASRCALTGGQIRNAALHSILLALGNGGQVEDLHLEAALQGEYRKAGGAYPMRPKIAADGQVQRLRQFANDLR